MAIQEKFGFLRTSTGESLYLFPAVEIAVGEGRRIPGNSGSIA